MSGKFVCSTCGTVSNGSAHTPGSILIEIVLWICLIVPGLIYSLWRHSARKQVCGACRNATLVPVNTPAGQRLTAKQG